jgi:D-hexose-6-phosphate mutarotase
MADSREGVPVKEKDSDQQGKLQTKQNQKNSSQQWHPGREPCPRLRVTFWAKTVCVEPHLLTTQLTSFRDHQRASAFMIMIDLPFPPGFVKSRLALNVFVISQDVSP